MQKKGNRYGSHRVIEPKGVLTQAAYRIDNNMDEIYSNEILVNVSALNIDSASFTQIANEAGHDDEKIGAKILEIVAERGKQQNPVTGSGGMFMGTVAQLGDDLKGKIDLKVDAQAILFESGLYAKLPDDMSEELALAALDVAGAPAQTRKLVNRGDSVLILGGAGKSGMLCCYEAMKRCGATGRVVALVISNEDARLLKRLRLCHEAIVVSATEPVAVLEAALEANGGQEYDVSICVVNVKNCEMSCILPVRDGGTVYFFSMATSFTKAALGAEGVGKDVTMIVGNGYTKGHAEITLSELRENEKLRSYFQAKYV